MVITMNRKVLASVVIVTSVVVASETFAEESSESKVESGRTTVCPKSGVEVGVEGGILFGKCAVVGKTNSTSSSSDKDQNDEKETLSSTATGFGGGVFVGGIKYIDRFAVGLRVKGGFYQNEVSLKLHDSDTATTSTGTVKIRARTYFSVDPTVGFAVSDKVTVFARGSFNMTCFKATGSDTTPSTTTTTATTPSTTTTTATTPSTTTTTATTPSTTTTIATTPSTTTIATTTSDTTTAAASGTSSTETLVSVTAEPAKSTKFRGEIGGGARISMTDKVFAELYYMYGFKVNLDSVFNSDEKVSSNSENASLKHSYHRAGIAIGYLF
jgi:hypothetical protein